MKIYISICRGRLGNELFQYLNILNFQFNPDNYIICINYNNISHIVETNYSNIKFINLNENNLIFKIINRLLNVLVNIKLITHINPQTTGKYYTYESNELDIKLGIISTISYITGFYQSEKYIKNINKLKINKKSKEIFNQYQIKHYKSDRKNIFIHIRKGDYRNFFINGINIVLPIDYYKKSISIFKDKYPNVFFHIFCDEDINILDYDLDNSNCIVSSENNANNIFIYMACLDGGILSNSSLSYIAGYYGLIYNKSYIAPKNHLGYKINEEIPQGINNEKFHYL
jgi:hypothetical protein